MPVLGTTWQGVSVSLKVVVEHPELVLAHVLLIGVAVVVLHHLLELGVEPEVVALR